MAGIQKLRKSQKPTAKIKDEKKTAAKIPKTSKKEASTAIVEQKKPPHTMKATKQEEEATAMGHGSKTRHCHTKETEN